MHHCPPNPPSFLSQITADHSPRAVGPSSAHLCSTLLLRQQSLWKRRAPAVRAACTRLLHNSGQHRAEALVSLAAPVCLADCEVQWHGTIGGCCVVIAAREFLEKSRRRSAFRTCRCRPLKGQMSRAWRRYDEITASDCNGPTTDCTAAVLFRRISPSCVTG